jgi:hypothetical protein
VIRFIIYYVRWIVSAFIMLPFMLICEKYEVSLWLNLLIGQSIGAVIFFNIDKMIFTMNKELRNDTKQNKR